MSRGVLQYETSLKSGKYLLMAHSTEAEVSRAREILQRASGAEPIAQHSTEPQPA